MHRNWTYRLILTSGLVASLAHAQQSCVNGIRVDGTITDPTGAVVPGAQIQASNGEKATSDPVGHYVLPCVPSGTATVAVQAQGFEGKSQTILIQPGRVTHANFQLALAAVQEDVQVNGDTGSDNGRGVGTTVLNTRQVQQLADDPDDFLTQLQALAASGGGPPESALVVVDGFQNGSVMPPKSAIASIRINPDLFSAEYESPPWSGGRIEITTKPGAESWHGALFYTDSEGVFNATDPFSITATPAGKRRYGFELSGPVIAKKVDFALGLEKRDINEFNVVNATTLDSIGNPTPFQQTVEAPQRLWIASARGDWQVSPKDVATLSFAAHVNNQGNLGVGGLTLPEAGYSSLLSEYDLRFTNVQTLSATLLHETRIGYTWKRTEQSPNSTAPALQVAGYFTGGGSTSQNLNNRERDLEIDDDVMGTHGKHSWKTGAQSLAIFVHDYDPDTFNGAFVFGGGSAPVLDANNNPTGQTASITPIEQYRRALDNLAGGNPTTYQLTSGTPLIPLIQWRVGLFAQDDIKLSPRLSVSASLRYQFQTTPSSFANFSPRAGLSLALDKKSTWVLHIRGGLFASANDPTYASTVYRLNGIRQQQTTIYSPSFSTPLTSVAGSIQVGTVWQFPHSVEQSPNAGADLRLEHEFRHHWNAQADLTFGNNWDQIRERNINAPMVASSTGIAPNPTTALLTPRPFAPNRNILQYENSGHTQGTMLIFSLQQNSYKWFNFNFNYLHMNTVKSDGGLGAATPQSSYSEKGENSRIDWYAPNVVSLFGTVFLPGKLQLSEQFHARSGRPYNITTGTDNNGDGSFNDRPAYAAASASGAGVYLTRFGLLTTNTVNGNVPRNLGNMPAVAYLDLNLSRTFQLNPKDKDHLRTVAFNARSANVLNHTNVTAVNTILSSSTVGQPVAADTARRLELGVRFSF
ncbi:TonB-dependent receptor [Granulicella sp. S156]|uniref:TonB-dependent receptor n=1 Tax=Granulicella sp. S156 TaxID=1747224 RepID=UPI00131C799B|nr:TonB-dependent receptor [Granulicella sp. S156]